MPGPIEEEEVVEEDNGSGGADAPIAIDPPLLEPVHTLFATSSSRCASSWSLEMLLFDPTARSPRSCKARLTGLVPSPRGVNGPGVFSAVDIALSARGWLKPVCQLAAEA